jgi:DNA-binding NtrC family response regulator
MNGKILVVDDDAEMRGILGELLGDHYQVSQAENAAMLKASFAKEQPDLVLLDHKMPPATGEAPEEIGVSLIPDIKKEWPETEIIMLTGHANIPLAVQATKLGAYYFLEKPADPKILLKLVENALETVLRRTEVPSDNIFASDAMKEVVRTVKRVAHSEATILITGESGTGKEVVADLIHKCSPRFKGPIVKINCAALPRELIESELFGSVKGAYTGAHADREGLFRLAEQGTLLLDEISEMPVDTQTKLLRVLQDQEVRPVGGKTSYKTDCRILCATNRKTDEAIRDGKLREDLFYRISAISVHLPPLRERRDDIMPLADLFLKRYAAQANRPITGYTPAAQERLKAFDWPGNVRQLQNEVQRAVLLCEGREIDAADLSVSTSKSGDSDTSFTLLEGVERNAIIQMLKETSGNKLETAKRLGIGRQTLYNKIKAYGIEV